jgi:transglutaminase-like putative cysteine protease
LSKSVLRWLVLAAVWLSLPLQARPFDVAPAPAWVLPLAPDVAHAKPAEELSDGVHFLLADDQVRFDGREHVAYVHRAVRTINQRGVEYAANVKIRFDPAYQRLTLHSIVVRRGGTVVSRLDPAAVRVLQRETELEALIYDGSMTAHAFLPDVRVDDIVEYDYSVRGFNPVFGQRRFGRFALQWGVPVARVHARLLWPAGRELQWRRQNDAPAPHTAGAGALREHRWDLHEVPGRRLEKDAPGWFDPFQAAEWSEFRDWNAVAGWAAPLYLPAESPSAAVRAQAARIAAQAAEPAQRLAAVLRFVQREVRYLGFEMGAGSHAPSAPDVVLQRRFGDCKDKALLMVAMLRALGVEAQPALVNTVARHAVEQWLPAPGAFNHVLVRARAGGREWWLDPTRLPQDAAPEQIVQADYGRALVIDGATTALTPMAGDAATLRRREVHTLIDASAGFDQPARYTVTTRVHGSAADALRATLADDSRDQLQKRYLNFYAGYYAGIAVERPMDVRDDAPANALTTVEHYAVKDFWRRAEAQRRYEASIDAPEMSDYVSPPRDQRRDSPLALAYPVEVDHTIQVRLSGRWDIKPSRTRIDDAAFEYEREVSWSAPGTLQLRDRYRSLRDHVPADQVGAYAAQLRKVRQTLDYGLWHGSAPEKAAGWRDPHWSVAALVGPMLIAFTLLAVRLHRWDPEPWRVSDPAAPRGLGGWLVVLALVIIGAVVRLLVTLREDSSAFAAERWLALTEAGGDAYHPLWAPLLLGELLAHLALLAGYALFAVLFVQRRSSAPRLFVALMALVLLLQAVDAIGLAIIGQPAAQGGSSAGAWIGTLLWLAYMLRSKRVRATFVERLAPPRLQSSTAASPSTTPS